MLAGCDRDDLPGHPPAPSRRFRPYMSVIRGSAGMG
jgi:hypothetical protein